MPLNPSDGEIIAAMLRGGGRQLTACVADQLRRKKRDVKTDWVRRRLLKMEGYGFVTRVSSSYRVAFCWSVLPPGLALMPEKCHCGNPARRWWSNGWLCAGHYFEATTPDSHSSRLTRS